MKNFIIANWFKVTVVSLLLVTTASASYYFVAKTKTSSDKEIQASVPLVEESASLEPVSNSGIIEPVASESVPAKSNGSSKRTVSVKSAPLQANAIVTAPAVTAPVSAPVVPSTSYNQADFIADVGAIYYPFNKDFLHWYNSMIAYSNKDDYEAAGGYLNTCLVMISTARKQVAALKAKYPKLSIEDFAIPSYLTTSTNNLYLNLKLYSLVINADVGYSPRPTLRDDQLDQITYNTNQANDILLQVHDYLSLHKE